MIINDRRVLWRAKIKISYIEKQESRGGVPTSKDPVWLFTFFSTLCLSSVNILDAIADECPVIGFGKSFI